MEDKRMLLSVLWMLYLPLLFDRVETIGRAWYYENGVSQDAELKKNFVVSVRSAENPSERLCLGTILNRKLAVTAAHCVIDSKGEKLKVTIVAETILENFKSDPNSVFRNVSNIFLHPGYDYKATANDIALLELHQSLEFLGTNITAAEISEQIPDYPECRVFGWGCETNKTRLHQRMQSKLLFIYDSSKCQKRYGSNFYGNEVCADYFGEIFCGNDTGGPLICNNKLVAVVSYLSDQEVFPNLFILVSRHMGFVHNPVGMLQYFSQASSPTMALKINWSIVLKLILYTIIFIILYVFIL